MVDRRLASLSGGHGLDRAGAGGPDCAVAGAGAGPRRRPRRLRVAEWPEGLRLLAEAIAGRPEGWPDRFDVAAEGWFRALFRFSRPDASPVFGARVTPEGCRGLYRAWADRLSDPGLATVLDWWFPRPTRGRHAPPPLPADARPDRPLAVLRANWVRDGDLIAVDHRRPGTSSTFELRGRVGPGSGRPGIWVGGAVGADPGAADALGESEFGRRRRVVVPGRAGAGRPHGGLAPRPSPRGPGRAVGRAGRPGRDASEPRRRGRAGADPRLPRPGPGVPPRPAGVGPGLPGRAPPAPVRDRPRQLRPRGGGPGPPARGRGRARRVWRPLIVSWDPKRNRQAVHLADPDRLGRRPRLPAGGRLRRPAELGARRDAGRLPEPRQARPPRLPRPPDPSPVPRRPLHGRGGGRAARQGRGLSAVSAYDVRRRGTGAIDEGEHDVDQGHRRR